MASRRMVALPEIVVHNANSNENEEWADEDEVYLRKLHMQAFDLYIYWNSRSRHYSKLNVRYNMPIVIISGVNSVFALMLQAYIQQNVVSNINAGLSMLTSIIGSIKLLLKITERYANSVLSAANYYKLCVKISKELSITRSSRTLSGKDFVNECYAEYTDAFVKSDQLNMEIMKFRHRLLLTTANNQSPQPDQSIFSRASRWIGRSHQIPQFDVFPPPVRGSIDEENGYTYRSSQGEGST